MAINEVIYAKCPYCKAEQKWSMYAASTNSEDAYDEVNCNTCGKKIRIKAREIMKFTAYKTKE